MVIVVIIIVIIVVIVIIIVVVIIMGVITIITMWLFNSGHSTGVMLDTCPCDDPHLQQYFS